MSDFESGSYSSFADYLNRSYCSRKGDDGTRLLGWRHHRRCAWVLYLRPFDEHRPWSLIADKLSVTYR